MAQLTIQQAFDLAIGHHQAGRLRDAEQLYRQVLAQQPGHAGAMLYLGLIALSAGRKDAAVDLIRRAILLNPDFPQAHNDLGIALAGNGQLDQAIASFRQAIALKPDYAEAHYNLGNALTDKGQLDEAIAACRAAIALRSDYAEAYSNLGNALNADGQLDEAVAACRRAIALQPNLLQAYGNLGNALAGQGKQDEAIAAFRQVIAINPNFPEVFNNLGVALKNNGQLDESAAAYRKAIALRPDFAEAHGNLAFLLHYLSEYDAEAIAEEHRQWNRRHGEPLGKFIQPHSNNRDPERRLRIGYVSPDFRDHVVGQNLLPLFQQHDRGQFEIACYSNVICPDAVTKVLRQNADVWRNIVGLSDEQATEQIRQDRIDILVDLALHTGRNRLLIFVRKPAPVQVCYLGYCGSTGLGAMDYRLSDPYLDPPETDLSCYSEKTVRLARSYWCYQPTTNLAISPSPALNDGFITFGCLNNFAKVSPRAVDLWARILAALPNSRMILHAHPGKHLDDIAKRLDRSRLVIVGKQSRGDYLKTYARIDIALDTFPYGGGITTCDALWMGVPVVTLSGQTAVGRGGRSILSNLGLTELVAFTPDQYVQIAVDLANDRNQMEILRQTMRSRMQASALMDAKGFARDVEAVFRRMWRTWCEAI